ncbi:anoctamin-10-like isoform X1 [Sphaeramia orbicularis]|uniref:anoctamin-10-like isoform X1 n=1 Tax=Sphaeramia orbicularis TaxID=375764 RepID=UPI00117CDFFF|nr:anoctamin-10-like isoform X1 [Sphaeramia orbicularis]XP_029991548.1 anoctamin-10-like isoform X1 [Sphaeramia orbicularis]
MRKAAVGDAGGGSTGADLAPGSTEPSNPKGRTKLSSASWAGPGWTKVSCPCCVSDRVDPLVLVRLGQKVRPETKRWIIKLIGSPQKDGGAALLAHPGEDASGDIIVVSAPRCTLLRATEELGLCKTYSSGEMEAFSYDDKDNFKDSDNMSEFVTLAERQYIVKYELEGVRAQKDLRVPGLSDDYTLQHRDNIWQKLRAAGVIVDMFPLHNQDQLKDLSEAWYCGNQLAQPLDSVNSYFGSSIGFYFSFLDFYTWSLLPPAVLGLAIAYFSGEVQKEVVESVSGSQVMSDQDASGSAVGGHMIQAVFSMFWSTVFMELWKRRSSSLSYRWGNLRLAERFAEPRPGFYGNLGVNPVTGRVEPLFPEWKRELRMALVSVPVVGLFLGLVVLGMLVFYWGEAQVQQLHQHWDSFHTQVLLYAPSVLHIIYTNILATVYKNVAQALTEYENHREESSFQNHVTAKVLVFTFFNYFAVLFHIAFYKQDVPLLRKRLASLLIITQLVNQVTEVVVPFLVDRFISASNRKENENDPEEDKYRNQSTLPAFPGLFSEYIELLVQFGYLSLFSCVYPLTAVLLLINNLTEIRSDAYKMCKLFRKPFSPPVANMGVWQVAFEVLSFVSVVSNCWLLLLSPRIQRLCTEGELNSTNILLLAVLVEHILILLKVVLAVLIPDEPDWIRKKREHMEFKSMQALRTQVTHSPESTEERLMHLN